MTGDPIDLNPTPILIFLKNNHFSLWWHVYISSRFLNPGEAKRSKNAIYTASFCLTPCILVIFYITATVHRMRLNLWENDSNTLTFISPEIWLFLMNGSGWAEIEFF